MVDSNSVLKIFTAILMIILGLSLFTGTDYLSVILNPISKLVFLGVMGLIFFLGGITLFILTIWEKVKNG